MEFDCLEIDKISGFDWDNGNIYKNENKHGLNYKKIEEVFFNEPLLIIEDFKNSFEECRCVAYGIDDNNNKIMIIFTIRENLIRVILARIMTKQERRFYENFKTNPYI